MKKLTVIFFVLLFTLAFSSCGVKYSKDTYEEISDYVKNHQSEYSCAGETEWYFYNTENGKTENSYYG